MSVSINQKKLQKLLSSVYSRHIFRWLTQTTNLSCELWGYILTAQCDYSSAALTQPNTHTNSHYRHNAEPLNTRMIRRLTGRYEMLIRAHCRRAPPCFLLYLSSFVCYSFPTLLLTFPSSAPAILFSTSMQRITRK